MKVQLIQFSIAHFLVYFERFNAVQIGHSCLQRIFQYKCVYFISHVTIFTFATEF